MFRLLTIYTAYKINCGFEFLTYDDYSRERSLLSLVYNEFGMLYIGLFWFDFRFEIWKSVNS